MLTPFGKAVRKIRIDRGISLKAMADTLGVSSSYVSAVENGRKPIAKSFFNEVVLFFNLNENERKELDRAKDLSSNSIVINVTSSNENARETLLAFARRFESLPDNELKKIQAIINNQENI